MDAKQLKQFYGKEYPVAVVVDGVRLPLERERRFSRSYYLAERKMGCEVPRFMDSSASLTLAQLEREWPTWTEADRTDFCQGCGWLREQADLPGMLRFVMRQGDSRDWSGVASSVAHFLPRDEAFYILLQALRATEIGRTSNLAQAIALTKHPDAEATLRQHLESIWVHKSLWDDDKFINWVAYDAKTCIQHLLELGAPPAAFEEQVRQLSQHVCSSNRDSCRNFLARFFSWLQ